MTTEPRSLSHPEDETTTEILADHLATVMGCITHITPDYVEDRVKAALDGVPVARS